MELAKPPAGQESVCDLHGDVTNLAWALQSEDTAVELYRRLAATLPAEPLYVALRDSCRGQWAGPEPDVDRAYAYMVASWLGRSGMAGTCRTDSQIAVRWTGNGGSPAGRFRAAVESIPDWHERLRNILVLRRDVFKVAASIEDERGLAVYCDPPYLFSSRKGDRGGGRYAHEFTADDHAKLAGLLRRFRLARVAVSYYADPQLAGLYPGWTQLAHTRPKHLSIQGRRGATKQEAPEVLLVNGPAYAESTNGDLF